MTIFFFKVDLPTQLACQEMALQEMCCGRGGGGGGGSGRGRIFSLKNYSSLLVEWSQPLCKDIKNVEQCMLYFTYT